MATFKGDPVKKDDHKSVTLGQGLFFLKGLKLKYQSLKQTKTASGMKTVITLQGDYDHCRHALDNDININQVHEDFGNLDDIEMTQDAGPFYNITLTFSTEDVDGNGTAKGSSYGKTSSELRVRMMSNALEAHPKYLRHWNYNLYATKSKDELHARPCPVSSLSGKYANEYEYIAGELWWKEVYNSDKILQLGYFADTAKTLDQNKCYLCWAKAVNELPQLNQTNINWKMISLMTKPNVTSYDVPCYELTETSKATSKNKAGWVLTDKLGKITKPQYGDFNLTKQELLGGNWLCNDASVQFGGKYWESTLTYTHSGDKNGWDASIYDYEKGYEGPLSYNLYFHMWINLDGVFVTDPSQRRGGN